MKLSELKTGERGVIVKVYGHGGFRKRIVEMGFSKGKIVEVLLNAPLQDPVKYKVLGYEVSMRRCEADQIEVVTPEAAATVVGATSMPAITDEQLTRAALDKRKVINVALVGNPHSGKTTLFNLMSGNGERGGIYNGETIEAKITQATFEGYTFNLIDLPGTYSLSAYSPKELYVRRQIIDHTPDVVINVLDARNLERNLYLTTQLIDMHLRMVCALNMFDEVERRGDHVDHEMLGRLFGVPMVPTVLSEGRGVDRLFRTLIDTYEGTEDTAPHYRHLHINHGHEIEHGITEIQEHLKRDSNVRHRYSTRYLAIKLLERDSTAEQYIRQLPDAAAILQHRDEAAARVKQETGDDSETAVIDAKYGFIHGALQEAHYTTGHNHDDYRLTHHIDSLLSNRYVGFPIFLLVLLALFSATFLLGQYPASWIEYGVEALSALAGQLLPEGPIKALITDGIICGVGSVAVFVPQIIILYLMITVMEDCGYMARAAFIVDKLMHKIGLHGKSFIPLVMGFGCNVPAILATRTIESPRSRLVTLLILPFMSCSARLPVYVMISAAFFAPIWQPLVLFTLYLTGILMAALVSRLLARYVVKGDDMPFVMELPPFRLPTWRSLVRHTWEKAKEYIRKMGGVILVASIIVWALGYFPHHPQSTTEEQLEQSYIAQAGRLVEPLFEPLGFNWKLDMALVAGVGAKEIIASTLGVLYAPENSSSSQNETTETILRSHMEADGITPATAFSFLMFVLLYFPCFATLAAIHNETGSWKWTIGSATFTTLVSWCMAALTFQIGSLLLS